MSKRKALKKLEKGAGIVPVRVRDSILERAGRDKNNCEFSAFSPEFTQKERASLSSLGFRVDEIFDYDGFTSYHSGYRVTW